MLTTSLMVYINNKVNLFYANPIVSLLSWKLEGNSIIANFYCLLNFSKIYDDAKISIWIIIKTNQHNLRDLHGYSLYTFGYLQILNGGVQQWGAAFLEAIVELTLAFLLASS